MNLECLDSSLVMQLVNNAELILTQANNITSNYILIDEDFQRFQVKIFQKRRK